jgi:hypothetical protein
VRAYEKRRAHIDEGYPVKRTGPIRPHEARLIEALEEFARIEVAERGRAPEQTLVVHFDGFDIEVTPRRTIPAPTEERDPSTVRFENIEID